MILLFILLAGGHFLDQAAASHALLDQSIVPHEWIEIGSPIPLRGDDSATNYTLPFPFDFYGTNYTRIWVSTNGLISFQSADIAYQNGENELAARIAIAPLWDDLLTNSGPDSNVYVGLPDPDHFLVRWNATVYLSNTLVNFEAILGRDATIRLNYGPSNGTVTATAGVSNGRGVYFANSITNSNNMSSFLYTPVFSARPPIISYAVSPDSPWLVSESVIFNASSSYDPDGSIVSYLWNFGDGANATTAVAAHTYTLSGTYSVSLTIRDDSGLTASNSTLRRVGVANAGLFDAWPETRNLSLRTRQNMTLSAWGINIGSLPISVRATYNLVHVKTGSTIVLSSQLVLLNAREEANLTATFAPSAGPGRYAVHVTFQFTPRDPSFPQPGWITVGTYHFRIRVLG